MYTKKYYIEYYNVSFTLYSVLGYMSGHYLCDIQPCVQHIISNLLFTPTYIA